MDTRPTVQIVRDCVAIVRDLFLIMAMLFLAYVVVRAGADLSHFGN